MPTVLVVDDSATDQRLAGGLIERSNKWEVLYATDGKDALVKLELMSCDVVVTDLVMPNMNGRELVETMQQRFPNTPVILMTSKGNEQIAVRALELGAASYVPKKRLAQDLVETVESVSQKSHEGLTHEKLMHRMTYHEVEFTIENDATLIPPLVDYLQHTLEFMKICSRAMSQNVGTAIEEALLNAIFHGNLEVGSDLRELDRDRYNQLAAERGQLPPYNDRHVYVASRITPQEANIVIHDDGHGFDTTTVTEAVGKTNFDQSRGKGLMLMLTFLDEVQYNDCGNTVTLVKRKSKNPTIPGDALAPSKPAL